MSSMIPGGGWRIQWIDTTNDAVLRDEPLVGWVVVGSVAAPLAFRATGSAAIPDPEPGRQWRLYHPDAIIS